MGKYGGDEEVSENVGYGEPGEAVREWGVVYGSVCELGPGLAFPKLLLGAKCRQSIFTNVIA